MWVSFWPSRIASLPWLHPKLYALAESSYFSCTARGRSWETQFSTVVRHKFSLHRYRHESSCTSLDCTKIGQCQMCHHVSTLLCTGGTRVFSPSSRLLSKWPMMTLRIIQFSAMIAMLTAKRLASGRRPCRHSRTFGNPDTVRIPSP